MRGDRLIQALNSTKSFFASGESYYLILYFYSTSNSSSEKGLSISPSTSCFRFRSNSKRVSKRYQAIYFLLIPLLAPFFLCSFGLL